MMVYDLEEASETLGVSSRTLRRYIKSGALRWFRVGRQIRITHEALMEYIEQQEQEAAREIRGGNDHD